MTERTPFVAGNWKMNGTRAALGELQKLAGGLSAMAPAPRCEVMICPPATLVMAMSEAASGTGIAVGGQDCHSAETGAHTGDIAAEMLADAGASAVIVGHSERRQDHGETSATVRAKASAAHRAGLLAVVCIGETGEEREGGKTLEVLSDQITGSLPETATGANTLIAYEPVWAIGTGLTPEPGDVAAAHGHIRSVVASHCGSETAAAMRILYGGSVKPGNAVELMGASDVDGALVGGASLKADDFLGIIKAYQT